MAGTAWAEEGSELKFFAAESIRHDSNLFRLSSGANAQALIGKDSAAETISATSLGMTYDKSWSLQRVDLDVRAIDYRYQNFSYLNFTALNYKGNWHWSYTPHLYGTLSTSREKTLNSFADFKGYDQRNERVTSRNRFDATYELDARWRVVGGLAHIEQTNLRPLLEESGSRQNAVDSGLRYVWPSGNAAGFTLRRSNGTYTDNPASAATLTDSGFDQEDSEADLLWLITPKTTASLLVGYRNRTHPNFSQRNFSGVIANAKLGWAISAKTAVGATWTRDIGAYQTSSTNFIQTERFALGSTWQLGAKTTLGLQLGRSVRDNGGSPGLSFVATQRHDVVNDATLSVDWRPQNYLSFNASLQNARRSSNQSGLDYKTNIVNVSAQFTF